MNIIEQEQKTRVLSDFRRRVKIWDLPAISIFLKAQASDLRSIVSPALGCIQPVDVDFLAEVLTAVGCRLENIYCEDAKMARQARKKWYNAKNESEVAE